MARAEQRIDVGSCARCGDDHEGLVFERLDQPMVAATDGTTWAWWASCPTSGQPILMRESPGAGLTHQSQVFACRR